MKESKILEKLLNFGRRVIPKDLFRATQPIYHYILAITGVVIYRFPAKKLKVIGVTGTKGKSTTVELINAILETAGKKTALANTIRYKIADRDWRNMFKMTLRGRFFTQRFLRDAVDEGCEYAIIEISSEGVPQFRHKFLYLDVLIFTNLAPEHIESHGSYENYVKAKLDIARELETSPKKGAAVIVNIDDKEAEKFLSLGIENKISYSLKDAFNVHTDNRGSSFQVEKTVIHMQLPGIFNIQNALGAIAGVKYFGITDEAIKKGLESVKVIRGRMEKIEYGQDFEVVVDYAHTPESLKAVYETYGSASPLQTKLERKLICVLGNTGGGRDKWKRPIMGGIANEYCSEIILTNEDPYDEDPKTIIEDINKGITGKSCEIVMDRRRAIRTALSKAKSGDIVLITGKGTDPYIMEANGKKTPWDDAGVVREELENLYAGTA